MEGEWVFSWQSAERFAPYLTAEDRNLGINKALVLYEWNINASLSLLRDIAHFEIALRNHYDATFQRYWNGDRHWLLSDDSPVRTPLIRTRKKIDGNKKLKIKSDVNFKNRKSIEIAIKKIGQNQATPGKIIAELTFGFWASLTADTRNDTVWIPYLHHAFPAGTNRKVIDSNINTINTIRNRIAHHEPLYKISSNHEDGINYLRSIHNKLLSIFRLIAPDAADYTSTTSTFAQRLEIHPLM